MRKVAHRGTLATSYLTITYGAKNPDLVLSDPPTKSHF
jgi:hypothetical protein